MNTRGLWEATTGRLMWHYTDPIYFWGHSNEHGYMSNWYPCQFEVGSMLYNCVEQYMMARKAMIFGDHETHRKIMQATEPRDHKKLGRDVCCFDPVKWDAVKINVVMMAVAAKFSQNPELHHKLMYTGKAYLVEASPYDAVWGAGLDEAACRKLEEEGPSINHMPGENLLGKTLCYVRDEMLC